jgi:hypothetical protein
MTPTRNLVALRSMLASYRNSSKQFPGKRQIGYRGETVTAIPLLIDSGYCGGRATKIPPQIDSGYCGETAMRIPLQIDSCFRRANWTATLSHSNYARRFPGTTNSDYYGEIATTTPPQKDSD